MKRYWYIVESCSVCGHSVRRRVNYDPKMRKEALQHALKAVEPVLKAAGADPEPLGALIRVSRIKGVFRPVWGEDKP